MARTVHGYDGTTNAILASGIADQRLLRRDIDTTRVAAGRETLRADVMYGNSWLGDQDLPVFHRPPS